MSYRNYSTIDIEEKEAAKEKNKRYILYCLPPNKRTKRIRYVWKWKCVDKNSWEYWVYYCSDGSLGMGTKWPTTGPAFIGLFLIWLLYRLLLDTIRLFLSGLSRLKEYFFSLAAKYKKNKQ
jgi:hypothetical protein